MPGVVPDGQAGSALVQVIVPVQLPGESVGTHWVAHVPPLQLSTQVEPGPQATPPHPSSGTHAGLHDCMQPPPFGVAGSHARHWSSQWLPVGQVTFEDEQVPPGSAVQRENVWSPLPTSPEPSKTWV